MVFPVFVYRFKCWTIQKAEHLRTEAFKLWCWRRRLRVSWTARRSNQSILKEISPEYSLEGLMLKLQYFCHLMQRTDSLEKTQRDSQESSPTPQFKSINFSALSLLYGLTLISEHNYWKNHSFAEL